MVGQRPLKPLIGVRVPVGQQNMFKGIIRKLARNDYDAVVEIFKMYWTDKEFVGHLTSRLKSAIDNDTYATDNQLKYLVAETTDQVVGVLGFRKLPEYMKEFAKTENPSELYILAVKDRGQGIGKMLVEEALKEIKDLQFTEVVLYSSESHKESWAFYDHLGFNRVGPSIAPNGELGYIWRMGLEQVV